MINKITSRLIKNMLSAGGQTILQTLILFFLYRYLIGAIGIEQLGIWSIVLASASATRVSELGLGGSVTKFVAAHLANGNNEAAAETLQTAAITVVVLFAAISVGAYPLLLWALPYFLPGSALREAMVILPFGLLSLCLTSLGAIWMGGLDACLRSDLRAGTMISASMFFFLLCLLSVGKFGLVALAISQVLQGLFIVIVGWAAIRQALPFLPRAPYQWKTTRFREMLSYGANFQIITVTNLLLEPATKILLGHYGGLSAAGYFEMAQRLVGSIRAFIVESNRVIVPVYAGIASYKSDVPELYYNNIRYLYFLVVPVFAFLLALMPAISEVWIGNFENQFVFIASLITVSWFINTLSGPAYFGYLGQGRLRWITIACLLMGASNILAGLFLGRIFSWTGVIIGFSFSLVLGSVIPLITFHHEHKMAFRDVLSSNNILLFLICFGAGAIIFVFYWILADTNALDKKVRVLLSTLSMSAVSFGGMWLHPLRINTLDSLKSHFKTVSKGYNVLTSI